MWSGPSRQPPSAGEGGPAGTTTSRPGPPSTLVITAPCAPWMSAGDMPRTFLGRAETVTLYAIPASYAPNTLTSIVPPSVVSGSMVVTFLAPGGISAETVPRMTTNSHPGGDASAKAVCAPALGT